MRVEAQTMAVTELNNNEPDGNNRKRSQIQALADDFDRFSEMNTMVLIYASKKCLGFDTELNSKMCVKMV